MKIDKTFLRSKVARRIFLLFISCALLPITVLAVLSFRHVTRQLNKQSQERLEQAAKAMSMNLFERLLFLEAGMEMELTVEPGGGYSLRVPEAPRKKIDISGFAGKAPGIKLAPREDFEERPSTIAAREAARKAAGLA